MDWDSTMSNISVEYGEDQFVGATPTTDGVEGHVPQPLAGDEGKFLQGDGSWTTPVITNSNEYTEGQGASFRVYAIANRWYGPRIDIGVSYPIWTQFFGTAAEPSVSWASNGFLVSKNTVVENVLYGMRPNHGSVTGYDYRLIHISGPQSGWDSDAETTYTTIASGTVTGLTPADRNIQNVPIGVTVPEDGWIVPVFRAIGASGTRYFYGTMTLELRKEI